MSMTTQSSMPRLVANVRRGANCVGRPARMSSADCVFELGRSSGLSVVALNRVSRRRSQDLRIVRGSRQQFLERLADRLDRLGVVPAVRASRASRSAALGRARGGRVAIERFGDHAGAGREVRRRIDQDEAAGAAVLARSGRR